MGRTKKPVDLVDTDIVTPVINEGNNMNVMEPAVQAKADLNDEDEVQVISLVPNVTYKDFASGDYYSWETVGHIEYMTFKILKNMWRNHKGYFRSLILKPLDDRVINRFGLEAIYRDYEFLMKSESYTRDNVKRICDTINNTQINLKYVVSVKISDMVKNGEITDAQVIRALEKSLDMDLISLL